MKRNLLFLFLLCMLIGLPGGRPPVFATGVLTPEWDKSHQMPLRSLDVKSTIEGNIAKRAKAQKSRELMDLTIKTSRRFGVISDFTSLLAVPESEMEAYYRSLGLDIGEFKYVIENVGEGKKKEYDYPGSGKLLESRPAPSMGGYSPSGMENSGRILFLRRGMSASSSQWRRQGDRGFI